MKPTIGRIVHYTLSAQDAAEINKRRDDAAAYNRANAAADPGQPGATGHQSHIGNRAEAGQVFPAMVVRVFDPKSSTLNLQVTLDGNDTFWAASRAEGDGESRWSWPART